MRKTFIWICALFCVYSAAYADTVTAPVKLDFASVSEMAAKRSLVVEAAKQDVETARQTLNEAKGYQRGKAGVVAEYLRLNDIIATSAPPVTIPASIPVLGGKSFAIPPVEIAPQDLIHLKLQAGYPIYTSGMLSYAAGQAKSGVGAYEALMDDTTSAVVFEANSIFLNALLTKQVIGVCQEALDSYNRHLSEAKKAYKAGAVAQYDVIRAETAVKEQEKRLTEANNQHELALAALRTALHLPQNTAIELNDILQEVKEPLTVIQAQEQAMKQNGLLKALEHKSMAQSLSEKFEKASSKPQVTGVSQVELLKGNIAQTDPGWFVGVEATMDIFDGGVKKARAAQKASEYKRTLLDREEAQDQIKLAIQSSYLDLDSVKSSLESSRQVKILASESLRLAEKRFQAGAGTSLEVLDANVVLSAAEVSEYSSLYQLNRSYLRLHRYVGDILEVSKELEK